MINLKALLLQIGPRFGILATASTSELKVIASNTDVAVGDLFLLPSTRGAARIYIFRATEYANVLSRELDPSDIARNKLTMPDSYFSESLAEALLLELKGSVLGYAEQKQQGQDSWSFHRPRRLPEHFTEVFRVDAENPAMPAVMKTLLGEQLGQNGLFMGHLLAGEAAIPVPVYLPAYALSHHIGVFGRTGSGKSNLMMVLLSSVLNYNRTCPVQRASLLAVDPHDEFRTWHASTGGADGYRGLIASLTPQECDEHASPFYYLTAKELPGGGMERTLKLSRADITPEDLVTISEYTEQQTAYAGAQYARHGERWIEETLMTNPEDQDTGYLAGTVSAVQRRLGFLRRGQTRIITPFNLDFGDQYDSLLPDILCSLEAGRVLIIDTTLMTELEQFLLTTVIARALFALRRALRSTEHGEDLERNLRKTLGNDDSHGTVGQRTLADELVRRLDDERLPYLLDGQVRSTDTLPFVNVVIEEAPSILNPDRMRFGSVFRDISRQGRKFGIGLTVVSQQVSEIDKGVLTQINTELIMALGNETERKEAIRNASADLSGFERELQVMGKGQVLVAASYKDLPLPVQIPTYTSFVKRDGF
ncbi:ATP-binding protein [Deinococcus sonorensis]|uniref:ATP-binding protein n=2 Tax=Deinococcus sonorensis TaxID=309891 RepID=A0AAU7UEZ5_9DEIO